MSALTPVAPRERLVTLDILRGFALLGVLIGNSYWLISMRAWEPTPDAGLADAVARWFVFLFVESKAQTLLTFLFGFGFAAQLLRAEDHGEPVLGLYLRRLVVLFGFGFLHTMLWWGDVTWGYALAGFGLLLFGRASNRTLIIWALVLTFVPQVLLAALPAVRVKAADLIANPEAFKRALQQLGAAVHGTRFGPRVPAHLRFAIVYQTPLYLWYYPWLLGRFLLGYVAGKQRWFDGDGAQRLPFFRKLLIYGVLADLPSAALTVARHVGYFGHARPRPGPFAVIQLVEQVGLLGLTGAYVALVVLLVQRPSWRRLLTLVAPAGRMPLTTYISQSVICTFLYYGWGLGWAGKVRSGPCVGLALAIFTLQVLIARVWLRHFRFGPLEWIWRSLVYQKRQSMRVTPAS